MLLIFRIFSYKLVIFKIIFIMQSQKSSIPLLKDLYSFKRFSIQNYLRFLGFFHKLLDLPYIWSFFRQTRLKQLLLQKKLMGWLSTTIGMVKILLVKVCLFQKKKKNSAFNKHLIKNKWKYVVKHQYALNFFSQKHASLKWNQKNIFEFYIKQLNYKLTKHYFLKKKKLKVKQIV